MAKVENHIKIEASPEAVWQLLGNLAQAPAYIPGIVKAEVIGTQRICIDTDGHEIREEISDYSPAQRSYRFQHVQSPLPVKYSQGKFAVVPDGEAATVTMEWDFEFLDPALAEQMTPMLDNAAKMTLRNLNERVKQLVS